MPTDSHGFVSRGGPKLAAGLDALGIDPTGRVCADLGCSVGGFTDCLLQRGATRVFAVDTAYGQLAWKLRQDPRVVVLERHNALHIEPPADARCGLVVVDLGWTRQRLAVPAAMRWLSEEPEARIVTLIKPHYESDAAGNRSGRRPRHGVLSDEEAASVATAVLETMPTLGVIVTGSLVSPVAGGKGGNTEYLAALRRV
jgi:23S rRNA (cytidine1920-2'-O)/16S rRNA (cytidine1409-2'-O)-methyltransferase